MKRVEDLPKLIEEYFPVWSYIWGMEPQARGLVMEAFIAKLLEAKRVGAGLGLVDIIYDGRRISMKTFNVRGNVRLTKDLDRFKQEVDEVWLLVRKWGSYGTTLGIFEVENLPEEAFQKRNGSWVLKTFPQWASLMMPLPIPSSLTRHLVDEIVEMLIERLL